MNVNRYGPVNGDRRTWGQWMPVAASQKFLPASAHFIYLDSSGHVTLALTATAALWGWACPPHSFLAGSTDATNGYWTSSATAGADEVLVYPACANLGVVFRVPCTAAAAVQARLGELCDIVGVNDGTKQYATPGTHTQDVLQVVGLPKDGDTGDILVTFNDAETQKDTG